MNYDNVNNPFDMYDEQNENNQFDDEMSLPFRRTTG